MGQIIEEGKLELGKTFLEEVNAAAASQLGILQNGLQISTLIS